jgi:uncharacterized membrane protein YcaP (DUF421 family)
MLFDNWESVGRIVFSAACIYVAVVAALRVLGEQALAKMSAYDLIVTVALGSLVATIPLSTGITVVDGLAAIGTYLVLQEFTRWLLARMPGARKLVKEQPALLVWEGQMLHDRMQESRVTDDEIRAAVRRAGKVSLSEVQAVVLENDGDWSVIPRSESEDLSAFDGLDIPASVQH